MAAFTFFSDESGPPFFDFESHWKVVENVVLISFTRRVESFPKCPFFIEQNETLCIFLCYYDFVMLVQLHWSLQQNTRMRLVFQLLYFYLCTKKSWLFNTELLCRICIFGNFSTLTTVFKVLLCPNEGAELVKRGNESTQA